MLFFILLVVGTPGPARAQAAAQPVAGWNNAVRSLAEKIVKLLGRPKTISLEVRNISSLSAPDARAIRESLEAELAERRVGLAAESSAETHVLVTLSEKIDSYVWVAQVRGGSTEQTAIVSAPNNATVGTPAAKPTMSLARKLIWMQREPLLDFSVPDIPSNGVPHMIVLEAERLGFYDLKEGQWVPATSIPLHPNLCLPRDTRGMIFEGRGELEAFLPGESCSGVLASPGDLKCASDVPATLEAEWPLVAGGEERGEARFQAKRNYFDGLTARYGEAEAKLPEFFSGAVRNTPDGFHWLLAEWDGNARLYDSAAKASATFAGWGDDIASVETGCDTAWQVLATGTGDWTQPDHIQIYEIGKGQPAEGLPLPTGRPQRPLKSEAVAVGPPLDFPGPILALWPSTDLKSVRAVSRNLQTGMYEASIVSVSCSE
jgi:hypothetical protein